MIYFLDGDTEVDANNRLPSHLLFILKQNLNL